MYMHEVKSHEIFLTALHLTRLTTFFKRRFYPVSVVCLILRSGRVFKNKRSPQIKMFVMRLMSALTKVGFYCCIHIFLPQHIIGVNSYRVLLAAGSHPGRRYLILKLLI